MDLLPISSPTVTTAPMASARQAQAQAQVAANGTDAGTASATSDTVQIDSTRTQTVQKSQRPASQNADQNTLNNANAGILFEYKDGERVMKVNDSKGVLIYQMPPKGELQLILEQERQSRMLETQA